jgi:hypothetical protein
MQLIAPNTFAAWGISVAVLQSRGISIGFRSKKRIRLDHRNGSKYEGKYTRSCFHCGGVVGLSRVLVPP